MAAVPEEVALWWWRTQNESRNTYFRLGWDQVKWEGRWVVGPTFRPFAHAPPYDFPYRRDPEWTPAEAPAPPGPHLPFYASLCIALLLLLILIRIGFLCKRCIECCAAGRYGTSITPTAHTGNEIPLEIFPAASAPPTTPFPAEAPPPPYTAVTPPPSYQMALTHVLVAQPPTYDAAAAAFV